MQKMSEHEIEATRKHVHAFWERRELPTVPRILAAIRRDENLPTISQSTLQRLLKKMNFKYVQRKRNSALIEREDIIRWRRTFITKIREFRAAGRPIYYFDETWVNAGRHTAACVGGQHHSFVIERQRKGPDDWPTHSDCERKALSSYSILDRRMVLLKMACCVLNRRPRALIITTR